MPLSEAEAAKWEAAIQAFDEFLEYAELGEISIAFRNLILRYVQADEGNEIWFEKFLEQIDGIFDLLDTLQAIYPNNENMDPLIRPAKS